MIGIKLSSEDKAKIGFSLGILAGFGFLLGLFAALGEPQLLPTLAGLWAVAWLAAQIPLLIAMRRDSQNEACARQRK